MNERLKELKKQAWEYAMAVHDGHIVPPLDKEVWPIDKVLDEKFAELIVQRTLDIVEAHTEIFQSDEAKAMVEHIKNSVKTDFGVEE